ncbi:SPOR domain-containing protein [Agrilutibacter solisilvae]|uniref:SPOR domain-containing protein n=1 Tax=Agrilutibacter solisilvae TaxID=2763317 RepID=A0A975ASJ7_9GAMM|nr:SPOR domain-containing protein [Lysobacter solisilvae]QSX79024.1 SPOR domain-containing protein [Lysobacter solisilvae]
MAAKRGKSQARRNNGGGNDAIPGWAWLVLGILLAVVVILVAPRFIKGDGDGFFRPQPNPDAEPVPVTGDEDAVAPEGPVTESTGTAKADAPAKGKGKDKGAEQDEEYDFYTLLPGKEVPLSDAELAATERAEAQRREAQQRQAQAQAAQASTPAGTALPKPVDADDGKPTGTASTGTASPSPAATSAGPANPTTTASATVTNAAMSSTSPKASTITPTAPASDTTRYLLQAGAFEASGQAEELKARIALLGLGARVESAKISGKTVYRVRMGPYGSASDLAEAKRKLSAGGLPALAIKVQ